MAKKKKHPEHENLERWLVSYADFITLLFATFTALYAMAIADISKMNDFAEQVQQGFVNQSLINSLDNISILSSSGKAGPTNTVIDHPQGGGDGVLDFKSMTYTPAETDAVEEVYEGLKKDVEEINDDVRSGKLGSDGAGTHAPNMGEDEGKPRGIEVSQMERGLKVSFDSRLLFKPGTASLKVKSENALGKISERLKRFNKSHIIHIEGHTDNMPISSAVYPSNWELSAARSSTVVRYLINKYDFDPTSLVAVGYGPTRPLDSNDTAVGRDKNRRVDIVIYSRKASSATDPSSSKQRRSESKLIRYEERDENNKVIKTTSKSMSAGEIQPNDEPVKVIIENTDGTTRVINPETRAVDVNVGPAISPSINNHPDAH